MLKPSDVLETKEWLQNRMFKYSDLCIVGCCMIGAWDLAYVEANNEDRVILKKALNKFQKEIPYIGEWNDKPGRTKNQVLAKLREFDL